MSPEDLKTTLGAIPAGDGRCSFRVWAPQHERVEVHVVAPEDRLVPLRKTDAGYHEAIVDDVAPGTRYVYRLPDGEERPDPASRYQPEGVHGPSEVVSFDFDWTDHDWRGIELEKYILYELHIGTFSREGTFDSAAAHLDELVDLGVTAIEIMPVAQFAGERNWGYDGVYPFAVQNSYGGSAALQRFVDAAHRKGLAVVLDVVYNHLGPEGNYLPRFGPYFTDHYRTPWGLALNFDQEHSDEVRRYFLENVRQWVYELHIDALRLDAIHAIIDRSAHTFLEEVAETVEQCASELSREIFAIAESDLNDPRVVRERDAGGLGLHSQWSDDFHHAIHAFITGERSGYYEDFGLLSDIARALEDRFVISERYSRYRKRHHGAAARDLPPSRFVIFSQNHDQVGNRVAGDRLGAALSLDQKKLVAGLVILSPYIPLLFMGEEWGETTPFQFFTSHGDVNLQEAVRSGRKEEFAAFGWSEEPPDPQAEATFHGSKLDRSAARTGDGRALRAFYRELIRFRKSLPPDGPEGVNARADDGSGLLEVERRGAGRSLLMLFNFGDRKLTHDIGEGWSPVLASSEPEQNDGKAVLSAHSLVVYARKVAP